ncbi:MAG: YicC/YloC family endoribonuclease [Hyphomicrobiales bacterium]
MALSSMTGFARGHGVAGSYAWAWELKSVNSKGLDLKLRLPPGWEAIEPAVRARAAEVLSRGSVFANLTVSREGAVPVARVNEAALQAVLAALKDLEGKVEGAAPSLDGILALKGVMEVSEAQENEAERAAAEAAAVAGFGAALKELAAMRRTEGQALGTILTGRLTEIGALSARAEATPGRKPEAIKARLTAQVAELLEASQRFDADRLHQEAIMLATKIDIREELDRLTAHVAQAKKLIADGGPIGRKLDFLAQELNRESNTLCSKANDLELSNIGLDLKAVVEQFREQVQNLE